MWSSVGTFGLFGADALEAHRPHEHLVVRALTASHGDMTVALRSSTPDIAHIGPDGSSNLDSAAFGERLVAAMSSNVPRLHLGTVAVASLGNGSNHSSVVRMVHGDPESRVEAARFVDQHDLAIIEFEQGVFGGPDGDDVLDLVWRLHCPVMTVLHSIPAYPGRHERSVVEELAYRSDALVVLSHMAHDRLLTHFLVEPASVYVIPYGIHQNPRIPSSAAESSRPTIVTWGVLDPALGVENALRAIANLRNIVPSPRLVVAGLPDARPNRPDTAAYLSRLNHTVQALALDDFVELLPFDHTREQIAALVRSSDVALLAYETDDHVVSPALVEAIAAAKPVVSTSFPHAVELLTTGAGLVVPHGDVDGLTRALARTLTDHQLSSTMRAKAAELGALMGWPVAARRFVEVAMHLTSPRIDPRDAIQKEWTA